MSEENEEGAEKCVPASKLKREHLELYDLAQGPTVPKSPTSPDESTQRKIVEIIRKKGQVKYDRELGLCMPSLTGEEAVKLMPPRLRAIVESYKSFTLIPHDFYSHINDIKDGILSGSLIPKNAPFDREKRVAFYREHPEIVEKEALKWALHDSHGLKSLDEALSKGYVKLRDWTTSRGKVFYQVKKPTTTGGFGVYIGPYHFIDNKTREEVRLWEWGVAYDEG